MPTFASPSCISSSIDKSLIPRGGQNHVYGVYIQGWPEPCIYTVYDRIFGDFPAKNTVYTLYTYGSGQPYVYTVYFGRETTKYTIICGVNMVLADPTYSFVCV